MLGNLTKLIASYDYDWICWVFLEILVVIGTVPVVDSDLGMLLDLVI